MQRKMDSALDAWANDDKARPLLIRGARRVGKTYAVKRLGAERFADRGFAYVDFQTNLEQLSQVFADTTDIHRVVRDLSLILRQEIAAGQTLLAFDEVQLCEMALNSLRFFAQSGYRVIATGSHLGIAVKGRTLPFPSGVDQIDLNPMDFEEFLWATGQRPLAQAIREAVTDGHQLILHAEALDRYRQYTVVGGMPAVVADYAERQDFSQVRTLQAEVDRTYTADIALYAPPEAVVYAQAVWSSIPKQLARETTSKFKYSDVDKGGRQRRYALPLAWLEAAKLVSLNHQTNETSPPLVARDGGSFFKVYLSDTGLLFHRLNLDAVTYLDSSLRDSLNPRFRGALAENYVMQALVANGLETFYWTSGNASAHEVEFVVQDRRGRVIPIEVKSGANVRSASLRMYMGKAQSPYAIRLSAKEFGLHDGILSLPLYAAFCIDERSLLEWVHLN